MSGRWRTVPEYARPWEQTLRGEVWFASYMLRDRHDVWISHMRSDGQRLSYGDDGLWFVVAQPGGPETAKVVSPGFMHVDEAMRWWERIGGKETSAARGTGYPGCAWVRPAHPTAEHNFVDGSDGTILREVYVSHVRPSIWNESEAMSHPLNESRRWQMVRPDGSQVGPLHDTLNAAMAWSDEHPGRPR